MTSSEIDSEIQGIFRIKLKQPELLLHRETTAKDVSGWTSLTHVRLMVAIEEKFKIQMTAPEIIGFKNYGELVDLVQSKVQS